MQFSFATNKNASIFFKKLQRNLVLLILVVIFFIILVTSIYYLTQSRSIEDTIAQIGNDQGVLGIQVATVDKNGKTDLYHWDSDIGLVEVSDKSIFRVASISKIFVALAVFHEIEAGTMDLDDQVNKYIQAPYCKSSEKWNKFTIRTLLNHTSGMGQFIDFEGTEHSDFISSYSDVVEYIQEFSAFLADEANTVKVGTPDSYYYSNNGYCILGCCVEIAARKSVEEILNEAYFDKMGVRASFNAKDFTEEECINLWNARNGVFIPYSSLRNWDWNTYTIGDKVFRFAGNLRTTASDIAKVLQLIANDGVYKGEQLISSDSIAMMETFGANTGNDGEYRCYPFMCNENSFNGGRHYWHTGNADGVLCFAGYNSETKEVVVVLTQGAPDIKHEGTSINETCYRIANACFNILNKG